MASEHRQHDEFPAFCRCLSRWPCELARDELAAENARLQALVSEQAREIARLVEAADDAATIIERMSLRVVGVDLAAKVLRAALAARGGEGE